MRSLTLVLTLTDRNIVCSGISGVIHTTHSIIPPTLPAIQLYSLFHLQIYLVFPCQGFRFVPQNSSIQRSLFHFSCHLVLSPSKIKTRMIFFNEPHTYRGKQNFLR